MEKIEAFTFNGIRTLIGALFLLPLVILRRNTQKKRLIMSGLSPENVKAKMKTSKRQIKYSIVISLVFFLACNFQQFAFYYSTAGKIAFITALYMFFVPLFGSFLGKKVRILTWISIIIGFVGLFLLCINPEDMTDINLGDILATICAIFYSFHILIIERMSDMTEKEHEPIDGVEISFTQFLISGTLTIILMFIFENPDIHNIIAAGKPILYAGIMSCGVAYTLQIVGQKYTEATVASLLMCMESVFAVITAAIVLNEKMTFQEILGCVIMFAAIILSQIAECQTI
jgi:drug/metabolite transporter (DMT)-like permease